VSAETKIPVRLTEAEALLLNTMELMTPAGSETYSQRRELALTFNEIDDLVERLRDEVVHSGFDADYALNERGRILEGLADRLFSSILISRPNRS
jgi:hypothetical protein